METSQNWQADGQASAGELIAERYLVVEVLGSGGMGEVLLAEDLALDNEKVAIKRLFPQVAANPRLVARFRNEVILARRLSHPGIVRIFDFGQSGPREFYISMEYVDGISLGSMIYNSTEFMTAEEIAGILVPLCEALQYAHDEKIIHRDLKPDNILISKNGRIKITDFGIARSLEESKGLTATNEVVGTAYYMSPEQFRGFGVDGRSDIYSLGVLAYEMAAKERPFCGENPLALAALHFSEELPEAALRNKKLPSWFQDFIDTCCEKDPADRFQSMAEAAEVLKGCCPNYKNPVGCAADTRPISKPRTIVGTIFNLLAKR